MLLPAMAAAQPDFSVTKTDSPDPVIAGANLTYTITVTNSALDTGAGALQDAIPANTTFVSFTSPAGWTPTTPAVGGTGTISATNPSVAPGSYSFTMVVRVLPATPGGGTITNTASSTVGDSSPENDSDTETTQVIAQADLVVSKNDSPDPVLAGALLTYTITVINNGPSDAQTVNLTDAIPAGTTFTSLTQTLGPAFSLSTPPVGGTGSVTAQAATFAAGASATFRLVVTVAPGTSSGTTISNTASVVSTTTDPNVENNEDTETTTVQAADFSVTKTDSPDPVIAGQNLTYTITVTNNGPDTGPGALQDAIPANTTFVSFTSPAGWNSTTPAVGGTGPISSSNGSVAPGNYGFTMVVHVLPSTPSGGTITNTASSTVADPVAGNNTDTEMTQVITQADLVVSKNDSPDPVLAGALLTYTITVTNNGPSDAQTVNLTDAIPAGATFTSLTQTLGPAFSLSTPPVGGTGNVTAQAATFAAGASATFQLVVTVAPGTPSGTTVTNTATVTSATTDPDVPNTDAETTTVLGAVVAAIPALSGWGIAALLLALGAAGLTLLRRAL